MIDDEQGAGFKSLSQNGDTLLSLMPLDEKVIFSAFVQASIALR